MSRRRRSRSTVLPRRHHGMGRAGAALAFVVMMLLLGALANTAPVPHAVVGFVAVVVALLCWAGAGSRR